MHELHSTKAENAAINSEKDALLADMLNGSSNVDTELIRKQLVSETQRFLTIIRIK